MHHQAFVLNQWCNFSKINLTLDELWPLECLHEPFSKLELYWVKRNTDWFVNVDLYIFYETREEKYFASKTLLDFFWLAWLIFNVKKKILESNNAFLLFKC